MEEVFAHEDEFPLAIFVLGDGVESVIVGSSLSPLSCEESGRVLVWSLQYDSYESVWCRFGLLTFCRLHRIFVFWTWV